MNKQILLIASISIFVLASCTKETKTTTYAVLTPMEKQVTNSVAIQDSEGYTLLKNNCYVCHNPKAVSHDAIIAPPFKAVKMHYSRTHTNKADFVDAIVKWVQDPTAEKALMYGAVKRFNVMPKLALPTEDLEKIASYLYDNDPEAPSWMGAHMKGMQQGKGMKKGQCGNGMKGCGTEGKSCGKKGC